MLHVAPAATRWPRPASLSDVVLALALTVVAQVDIWGHDLVLWGDDPVPGPRWSNSALFLVATASVAWRRATPLGATAVGMGALAVQAVSSGDAPIGLLVVGPVLVLVYAVGCYATRTRAWVGLLVAAAATAVHELFDDDIRTAQDVGEASYWWLVVASTWLVGRYVGARRRARHAAEQARLREEELTRSEREAVAAERLRIANELHDVVAHNVSVVALQAGAALELLDRTPERARGPLEEIERTARDALVQMGRLVGLLRTSGEPEAEGGAAAQPKLADLPALVERAASAGLPVHLTTRGSPRPLAPGVELSAYRIVQEAVTNALRHAAGATRVDVELRYGVNELVVVVSDDGHGPSARPRDGRINGSGHGLVGMRERAAVYGGELHAGVGDDGGFVVRARLPLTEGVS